MPQKLRPEQTLSLSLHVLRNTNLMRVHVAMYMHLPWLCTQVCHIMHYLQCCSAWIRDPILWLLAQLSPANVHSVQSGLRHLALQSCKYSGHIQYPALQII